MKKKTVAGRSSAKTSRSRAMKVTGAKGAEEYIAGIPDGSRKMFDRLRAAVAQAVPKDAVEVISYGILAFKREKVLVWIAAFARHCSLFPTASVLSAFEDELKGYVVSKGTVQFPLDQALPVALVKKLVRARVAEANAKEK
jgi:uncharacterized protein YdhG (YjbR/CyaY superfamily)